MKTIKFIIQTTIISVLSFITIFLIILGVTCFIDSIKQDEVNTPTTQEVKHKPYTESIYKPKRKPNISDKEYAYRLMSVRREQITDINVLSDYDGVIKTVRHNINNDVANEEDYQLLNTYNRTNGGSNNE